MMTPAMLAAIVGLATLAAVAIIVRIAVRPLERAALELARAGRCRDADILTLRLLPLGAALLAVSVYVLPAFAQFEPRGRAESAGAPILLLAGLGAALLSLAVWRAARDLFMTRRLVRGWLARARRVNTVGVGIDAFAVDMPEPLVAVTGILRRRLFISERVLAACGPAELAAILQHELGHARAADNLKRLLLRACPGAWWPGPHDRSIERAWSAASEDAADDFALARGVSGVDLASALVAVVRLGAAPAFDAPVSAFHEGDDLTRRVRRALNGPLSLRPPVALRLLRAAGLTLMVVALATAMAPGTLFTVHQTVERAIAFLR